jgi:hypothetical protein
MSNEYISFKLKSLSKVKDFIKLILIENKNKIYLLFTFLIKIINKKAN